MQLHTEATPTLFPLDGGNINLLYDTCFKLIHPATEEAALDYYHKGLRNIVDRLCADGFKDMRTAALFEQCQLSMKSNTFDVRSDNNLHQAVCRFVGDKDSLLLVHKSTAPVEQIPNQPTSIDNERAAELLGDLDYAHDSLRFINRQAQSLVATLGYAERVIAQPEFQQLDREAFTAMISLVAETITSIQNRAATAAASIVTKDALLEQLNTLEEPIILNLGKYTITNKGSKPWIENENTGEGKVLTDDEVDTLDTLITNVIDAAILIEGEIL
jgi:hypothetical protein